MKRDVAFAVSTLLLGIVVLGCEPPRSATNSAPAPGGGTAPVANAPASPAASPAPLPPETKFGVFAGDVNDSAAGSSAPPAATPSQPQAAPPAATPPAPAQPETERVKAQAGVGIQGQSLKQYE